MPRFDPLDDDADFLALFRRMFMRKDAEQSYVYHDLVDHNVRFAYVLARPTVDDKGNKSDPPIMENGVRQYLKVQVVPLLFRSINAPDVIVQIDGEQWDDWKTDRREAVVDGSIYACVPVRQRKGELVFDDLGRLKLRIRKPDLYIKGYKRIAELHGKAAVETDSLNKLAKLKEQLSIDWTAAEQASEASRPSMYGPETVRPRRRTPRPTDEALPLQ